MVSKTVIIGDLHGTLEEFDELIKKVELKPEDKLILLGDLIDRGPDSLGCVRRAQELKAISLLGNHEIKFITWFRSNKKVYPKFDFYDKFNDDDIEYIHKMPLYLRLNENFVAVHGGFKPHIPYDQQKRDDCCYRRFVSKNGEESLTISRIRREKIKDYCFWTKFWTGPDNIIYGHQVHGLENPKIEEATPNIKCYGIDTGCCFGGRLTAFILETQEIVQVKAKQIYYKSDWAELEF